MIIDLYWSGMCVVSGYVLCIIHSDPHREWYDVPLALACGLFWPAYIIACAWSCTKWWKR